MQNWYAASDGEGVETRKADYQVNLTPMLRSSLLDKNIDYLLVLYSDYIYSYSQIGVKQVHSRSQLSVVDVKTNQEIYFGPMVFAGKPEIQKTIREIEDNDLAMFKQLMLEGIDFVAGMTIPKALGIAN